MTSTTIILISTFAIALGAIAALRAAMLEVTP
jgi:hypothetical protein